LAVPSKYAWYFGHLNIAAAVNTSQVPSGIFP